MDKKEKGGQEEMQKIPERNTKRKVTRSELRKKLLNESFKDNYEALKKMSRT